MYASFAIGYGVIAVVYRKDILPQQKYAIIPLIAAFFEVALSFWALVTMNDSNYEFTWVQYSFVPILLKHSGQSGIFSRLYRKGDWFASRVGNVFDWLLNRQVRLRP